MCDYQPPSGDTAGRRNLTFTSRILGLLGLFIVKGEEKKAEIVLKTWGASIMTQPVKLPHATATSDMSASSSPGYFPADPTSS